MYDKVCKTVFTELDKQLEYKSASVKMRKKLKFSKPYWSDELNVLWKDMNKSEKQFAKCKGGQDAQRVLRLLFKEKQQVFDKALCKAARQYNRNKVMEIENACQNDPKIFLEDINP